MVTVTPFIRQNVSPPDDFSNPQFVHLGLISNAYSRVWFLDSPKPGQYGPRGFKGGGEQVFLRLRGRNAWLTARANQMT
jgi:hypothetical protein